MAYANNYYGPQFTSPSMRSRFRGGNTEERKYEDADSGTESPSDQSIHRQSSYFENDDTEDRSPHIVFISENEQQTRRNTLLEKSQEDYLIVTAKYVEHDSSAIFITCESVNKGSILVKRDCFVLGVFHDSDSTAKLYIKVDGLAVSSILIETPVSPNSILIRSMMSLESFDVNNGSIELEKRGTMLIFEHPLPKSLQVTGTLTFSYVTEDKKVKLHTSVEVRSFLFPFTVQRRISSRNNQLFTRKKITGDRQKVRLNDITAWLHTAKDLCKFFALDQTKDLIFNEVTINLDEREITKDVLTSLTPTEVNIDSLNLKLLSKNSDSLAMELLSKLRFCRYVRLYNVLGDLQRYMGDFFSVSDDSSLETFPEDVEKEHGHSNLLEFFVANPKPCRLEQLELFRVDLQFGTMEKLQAFKSKFVTFVQSKLKFTLVLEQSLNSFPLVLLLSSIGNENRVISKPPPDYKVHLDDLSFSITFENGSLNELVASGTVSSKSYEKIREVCQTWLLKPLKHINCEDFSLVHQNRDYKWLFQLNNWVAFDPLSVLGNMQVFKLHRESLIDAIEALSKISKTESSRNVSMENVTVEISASDSRSEMDELIVSFCSKMESLGLEIESLTLEVRNDISGWAFIRFTLTSRKTTIVTKGVKIIFPPNTTTEPRPVAIEIHQTSSSERIETNAKKEFEFFKLTPLVIIDHTGDEKFLQLVSVVFDYPETVGAKFLTTVYSKHPPEKMQWEPVDYKIRLDGKKREFVYQSNVFSPVVGAFHTEEGPSNPNDLIQLYFAESTFVTILALEHRLGNVVFDCIKEKDENEGKHFRLLPFFEKRKVGKVEYGQKIIANFGKNLTIEEPEPEMDNAIEFFSPEHEDHVSNKQEYKMRKVDPGGDSKGYILYNLKTNENEKKIGHLWYQLPQKQTDLFQSSRDGTPSVLQYAPG